ncbi:DUF3093 family protein [uncultured Microbacterium sp.]|uniref:DUF3093 domain-containing protein n=1 Tax=uncultured Microbacterium sp. TaxID=191216 RepID=A0A1Y5NXB4_9MICO|nr:conserved hypothetical protein [uncultured Microbacterium sp.]
MTAAGTRPAAAGYRERLSPSLWALVSAAVGGPMVALVFAPIDPTLALVIGAVAGIAIVAALIATAPVVAVAGGELHVGRAHIDVAELGVPVALAGEDARQARGPGLGRGAWHLLRGGVDGVVRVPVQDADDPVTEWVFSSRTPDRVVAAIRRAQSAR